MHASQNQVLAVIRNALMEVASELGANGTEVDDKVSEALNKIALKLQAEVNDDNE